MGNAANDNCAEALDGKVCNRCGEFKLLYCYYKRTRKSGFVSVDARCKDCVLQVNMEWRAKNPEKDRASRQAYYEKNAKAFVERVRQWRKDPVNHARKNELERARRKKPEVAKKNNEYNNEWRNIPENRERYLAARRARRNDPEYRANILAKQREYYSRPEVKAVVSEKGKIVKSTREWKDKFNSRRRERYKDDPLFFCAIQCRSMVVRVARKAKTTKSASTLDSIGYAPDQLRQRMECQFQDGMTWANHGDWHIDHKKPILAFLRQGKTDPKLINALSNLQPLWGEENQAKGGNWPIHADNDNIPCSNQKAA